MSLFQDASDLLKSVAKAWAKASSANVDAKAASDNKTLVTAPLQR